MKNVADRYDCVRMKGINAGGRRHVVEGPMAANKKVIYTVITNKYDYLFPALVEQEGWDMVCFSDDAELKATGWTVMPLPPLPELEGLEEDPVRAARMVKILPHRFLQEYEYSLYIDGNRVLADKAEVFTGDGSEPLLCLQGVVVDPYAGVDKLLAEDEKEDLLLISEKKPLDETSRGVLNAACRRWRSGKLREYCGCPGTAMLGRRHNEEQVAAAMEVWAKEVLQGSELDEFALPYACHVGGIRWAENLNQMRVRGRQFSEAERVAIAMQHVRLGDDTEPFVKPVYEKNPPPPGGKYDGYPYLLTIGVPVSNQIGTIRRCLDGIKPILDALPAELVVVDTGSTDGTVEAAMEYGARVVKFPWINDMSAARNTGIRAAQGSWYMSIDDDEWFEDATQIIEFFKTGAYKDFNVALYSQRNYRDKNMTADEDIPAQRMGKMTPGLHFEGRIHDALMQEEPQRKVHISVAANHLGFASDDPKAAERKSQRNVAILKEEVKNYPDDMRFAFQLLKEYSFSGRNLDAIRMMYWILSLTRNRKGWNGVVAADYWTKNGTGLGLLNYLMDPTYGQDAIEFYEKYIDITKYNPLDQATIAGILATAHAGCAQERIEEYKISNDYVKLYHEKRKKFLSMSKEQKDMLWYDLGLNNMEGLSVLKLTDTMLRNYSELYKTKEADALVLDESMVEFFCEEDSQDYRVLVTEYAVQGHQLGWLKKLLPRLAEKNGAASLDYLYTILCDNTDETNVDEIEAVVKKAGGNDAPFLQMLHLIFMEEGDPAAADTFQKAVEYVKGTLFFPKDYFRSRLLHEAFRLKLDTEAVFAMLNRSAADFAVKAIRRPDDWGHDLYECMVDWWRDVPEDALSMERYLAFHVGEMVFEEKAKNRVMEPGEYVDSFAAYIRCRYAWERDQAAVGLLDGDGSEELEAPLRAVCAAQHALDLMERGENIEAMRSLKVVIEQEPRYNHVVELMNDQLKQETEQHLERLSEMDALLAELKPKLRQLLAAGQAAEVKTILSQLEQMAPLDAELQEMKKQLVLLPPS